MNAITKMLRRRALSVSALAKLAGCGRSHVTQCLANKPGRGGQTRGKLAVFLTPRELQALGWDSKGKLVSATATPTPTRSAT